MNEHLKNKFNELIKEIITHEFDNSDVVKLLLPSTDNWECPLPSSVTASSYFVIDLVNWSKEESHHDDNGIYIRVAFGNEENSKFFRWDEIKGILASDNKFVVLKPYDTNEIAVPKNLSMKDVMHDDKGQKKSMESLLKKNPHLKR